MVNTGGERMEEGWGWGVLMLECNQLSFSRGSYEANVQRGDRRLGAKWNCCISGINTTLVVITIVVIRVFWRSSGLKDASLCAKKEISS